jgi:3-deoxy-D-manno-octulosonate 8-phosphate phosphatase (KDO 8-P phosphatase)
MNRNELVHAASQIRFVFTDVDGVLTDNGVYYSAEGELLKKFSIRDGMGVERLRIHAGIETGILTGELSASVKRRAEKLNITEVHLGVKNKLQKLEEILISKNLRSGEVAFIGDDVNDLDVMLKAGISACPNDAMEKIKQIARFQCKENGGHGAFREFAEWLIETRKTR